MKNLQEIINKRAETRAKTNLDKLCAVIRELPTEVSSLLDKVEVKTEVNNDTIKYISLRSLFWNTSGYEFTRNIVKALTELYIPEESEKFVKQVDSLQSQINDLQHGN